MYHLFAGNDSGLPMDNYRGVFPTLEAAWVLAKQYHWAQLMESDESQSFAPYATMEINAQGNWMFTGERTIQGGWRLTSGEFADMETIEQTREPDRYGGYGGTAVVGPWEPDVPGAPKNSLDYFNPNTKYPKSWWGTG